MVLELAFAQSACGVGSVRGDHQAHQWRLYRTGLSAQILAARAASAWLVIYTLLIQAECAEAAAQARLCHPDDFYCRALNGEAQPSRYAQDVMVQIAHPERIKDAH